MIVFRVDGGLDIGIAHVVRCLNIAKSLDKEQKTVFLLKHYDSNITKLLSDYKIVILTTFFDFLQENQPEKIVFDISHKNTLNSLNTLVEDIRLLNSKHVETIMLDGATINDAIHQNIDTKVNFLVVPYPNIDKNDYKISEGTMFLTGLEYFVFNDAIFREYPKKNKAKGGILISMGGSDEGQLSIKILDLLKDCSTHKDVIISKSFNEEYRKKIFSFCEKDDTVGVIEQISIEEMYKDIQASDLLITSVGLTKYEASFLRTPSLVVSIDDRMKGLHLELENMGIYYFGCLNSADKLIKEVKRTIDKEFNYKFPRTNNIYNLLQ